jgi:hypothetical protein
MNEGDETIPSMVTRKRKRRSGLKFSSQKTLKQSRQARLTSKARCCNLFSETKVITFLDSLSSERGTTDLHDCSTGSDGQTLF